MEELTPEQRLHLKGLTWREAEVVLLCGSGHLVKEAARQLTVSESTVKTLLARGRAKLHCQTVRDVTRLLLQEGLLNPSDLRAAPPPAWA